jgi:hypothetical protein
MCCANTSSSALIAWSTIHRCSKMSGLFAPWRSALRRMAKSTHRRNGNRAAMILIQHIETCWLKNERGAQAGALRDKTPAALPIPLEFSDRDVHGYASRRWNRSRLG